MRKLVSSAAAQVADRVAQLEFGYPDGVLMEEAGTRLQDRLEHLLAKDTTLTGPVVYLVGPGHNGGDALVMARQAFLRGRSEISVVMIGSPKYSRWQADVILSLGIPCHTWPETTAWEKLRCATLWVDGIQGTGLQEPPRSDLKQILAALESERQRLDISCFAIDVPSGLWEGYETGDVVLQARWTISMGWLKDFCFFPGARDHVGHAEAISLAFPREAEPSASLMETADLAAFLPRIPLSAYKGTRGHVALVGAAPGMSGALVLAARAAAAAGAGLVSLGLDSDLISLVAPQVPAFQTRSAAGLSALVSRYDSLVVGPGWGRTGDRPALLKEFWMTDLPMVLDADALVAWVALKPVPRKAPVVMTPHPGEFLRLGAGEKGSVGAASELARKSGVTIVLKGSVTWILAPDGRRAVWDGSNPALGTGGSGDCLAGIVGAMLAHGMGAFEAAQAAVVLHGTAGKQLADTAGWFTADQLPEAVAKVASACMLEPGPL